MTWAWPGRGPRCLRPMGWQSLPLVPGQMLPVCKSPSVHQRLASVCKACSSPLLDVNGLRLRTYSRHRLPTVCNPDHHPRAVSNKHAQVPGCSVVDAITSECLSPLTPAFLCVCGLALSASPRCPGRFPEPSHSGHSVRCCMAALTDGLGSVLHRLMPRSWFPGGSTIRKRWGLAGANGSL